MLEIAVDELLQYYSQDLKKRFKSQHSVLPSLLLHVLSFWPTEVQDEIISNNVQDFMAGLAKTWVFFSNAQTSGKYWENTGFTEF